MCTRTFRVIKTPSATEPGWVRVVADGIATDYQFSFLHVAEAMGLCAVGFLKTGQEQPYHVRVDEAGNASCDCLGFLRWDHCRHGDLAKALILELGRRAAVESPVVEPVPQLAPVGHRVDRFTADDGQTVELRKAPAGWEWFVELGNGCWRTGVRPTKELASEDARKYIARRARFRIPAASEAR
jgi:hypothetical protein